jgi:hypothetical protein
MKILHITPDINFAINFVKPICLEQTKLGFDVTIISTKAFYSPTKDDDLSKLLSNDAEQIIVKSLNLRIRKLHISLLTSYIKFIRMLKLNNYDIIVFHTTLDTTLPIILSKIFSDSKRIYFNHGVPSLGYKGLTKYILEVVEKLNIAFSHSVFTIGPSMKEALNKISPKVLPHFVPPGSACGISLITEDYDDLKQERIRARERLGYPSDLKIILYVGRPVKRKGLFDVLDSWNGLNLDKNHLLLMAGPNEKDFKNKNITLSSNTKPLGYISNMVDYYLSADILCMPSYHEGLGYTYLEAASAGCVSICSDIPGPTDFIVNDITGLTVKAGSSEQIGNSIAYLISNPSDKMRLSKEAFKSVLKYNRKFIASEVAIALVNLESIK